MYYHFLEAREQEYFTLIRELNAPEFLKNAPYQLLGKPYHNSHHLRSVAVKSSIIGHKEGLSPEERRLNFIAAVFHDLEYLHHSREEENIGRAINSLIANKYSLDINDSECDKIIRSIENTKNIGEKDFTRGHTDEWILHDADLSIWFNIENDELKYLFNGISEELGINTDLYTTKEFLNKHGFATLSGQQMLEEFNEQVVIAKINSLIPHL